MAIDWNSLPKFTFCLPDEQREKVEKLKQLRTREKPYRRFHRYIVSDAIDLLYEKEMSK